MMFNMKLGSNFSGCPNSWQNFIIQTSARIHGSGFCRGLTVNQIQKELDQFKATYTDYGLEADGEVDFPSEGHYNLFVLKYGEEDVKR
jgi:hypothetical protein